MELPSTAALNDDITREMWARQVFGVEGPIFSVAQWTGVAWKYEQVLDANPESEANPVRVVLHTAERFMRQLLFSGLPRRPATGSSFADDHRWARAYLMCPNSIQDAVRRVMELRRASQGLVNEAEIKDDITYAEHLMRDYFRNRRAR